MSALTGSVNFLLILLGLGIGAPIGVFYEKMRIKLHHARKALYMAMPLAKAAGYVLGAFGLLAVLGVMWVFG